MDVPMPLGLKVLSYSNCFIMRKICLKNEFNVKFNMVLIFEANLPNFNEKSAKNLTNEIEFQLRSIFDTVLSKLGGSCSMSSIVQCNIFCGPLFLHSSENKEDFQ